MELLIGLVIGLVLGEFLFRFLKMWWEGVWEEVMLIRSACFEVELGEFWVGQEEVFEGFGVDVPVVHIFGPFFTINGV